VHAQPVHTHVELEQVIPFYQPIYALKAKTVVRYECLARLLNAQQQVILPNEFLYIIEKHDDRVDMTSRILELSQAYCKPRQMSWSVNLFASDLQDAELVNSLQRICTDSSKGLCGIEIHFAYIKDYLPQLRLLLTRIPHLHITVDEVEECTDTLKGVIASGIHAIKIKGELIKRFASNEHGRQVIADFREHCQTHQCALIAEHIEDQETLDAVQALGIEYGQGFYLSHPVPKVFAVHSD
jgi:EAL domain-containing protein (putative c-di-GMP-specific phosphodiesterase class I)